ncbi:acyl-CoA carboxylase subunit beta [Sediminitomix flava]|uniref:Acetyl-CoA carboxylase carboxyltransferase component n=1 Tax=Sediminitomix flava TaxID=379075 RepID=A0A315ZFK5_SEDFL|nr:carboxyl transferase domain-containing protein [Sediminitomix flava]PWJ43939.1 acetyl-CoA carboxylase carboxyltransferase component [Sediminitomix flava]
MRLFQTQVNKHSEAYQKNYEEMSVLLNDLNLKMEKSRFQGKEKHILKARSKGKLLARERVELLLDQDSPFLELMPLVGLGGKGLGVGGTTVGGVGLVCGKLCMVISNIGTLKGGAVDYATLNKSLRLGEIAEKHHLPVVNLVESAGAHLPEQERIFNYGGASFRDITRRSKKGIPNISVVFGNSTAGGAYVPGMSDYAIFVKDKAKVFLAGPPLVKMATNEVVDDESLGGASMHSKVSGVSDYLAEDEYDAIRLAREVVAQLKDATPQQVPDTEVQEPVYDIDELLGIVSADIKVPYDAREVIARIVDGSEFSEFKPDYGNTLVTCFAKIHGYKVGIIANNGVLFSESANKGAQFIQLCNQNNTPLIFLQNITGFMVGKDYEEGGIIKNGAKLINAVSNSEVPSITLMVGASFGAGNYAMNGRAYEPDFLFAYPNSKIAVMGGEQLAGVMELIQREAAQKAGLPYDEEQAKNLRAYMMAEVDKKSTAFYSTGQLWDDGILDPRESRNYLGFCLAIVNNKVYEGTSSYGVFRM